MFLFQRTGIVSIIIFLLFINIKCFGIDFTWNGSTSTWNNPANWTVTSGGSGIDPLLLYPGGGSRIDNVVIGSGGTENPKIHADLTIGQLTFGTKVLDLDSKNLTLTSTSILSSGQITNGVLKSSILSSKIVFSGCNINAVVECKAQQLYLNGSVFEKPATFEIINNIVQSSSGGNKFKEITKFIHQGTETYLLGVTSPDEFFKDVYLINKSISKNLHIAYNSSGNIFRGNIILSQTTGNTIFIGYNLLSTCEIYGTFLIGEEGFQTGSVVISHLKQNNASEIGLTLPLNKSDGITKTNSVLTLGPGIEFSGKATFRSPQIYLNGTVFQQPVIIEKTGSNNNWSDGNNIFNKSAELINSGADGFYLGNKTKDNFNDSLTLSNTGYGFVCISNKTLDNLLNGDVFVNSTNGSGVILSGGILGTSVLAAGKLIKIGKLGFTKGELRISGVQQIGNDELTINIPSNLTSYISINNNSHFKGKLNFVAPAISIGKATFDGPCYFEKNGSVSADGTGGAIFNNTVELVHSGSMYFVLGATLPDIFNYKITCINKATSGDLHIGYNSVGNMYKGDIEVSSLTGRGIYIGYGTLAYGEFYGNLQIGPGGFQGGYLGIMRFIQKTSNEINLVFADYKSDGSLSNATIHLGPSNVFEGKLTVKAPQLMLNGSTFNGVTKLEKSGAGLNFGNGGNIFNNLTEIIHSGSGRLSVGASAIDIYNADITLTNTGSGYLAICDNIPGHIINGNIVVNCTNGAGVMLSGSDRGTSVLKAGKIIRIGELGFTKGELRLSGLNQEGNDEIRLELPSTATSYISLVNNPYFRGKLTLIAPAISIGNSTYEGPVYFEKNGSVANDGQGGAWFKNTAEFVHSGSQHFILGTTLPDRFDKEVIADNRSTSGDLHFAYKSTGNIFYDNVKLKISGGKSIYFSYGSTGRSAIIPGKTFILNPVEFVKGGVYLSGVDYQSSVPLKYDLSNTSSVWFKDNSVWNAEIDIKAGVVLFGGGIFKQKVTALSYSSSSESFSGQNIFENDFSFTSNSTQAIYFGKTNADQFNFLGNATFIQNSSGQLFLAANGSNLNFYKNVIFNVNQGLQAVVGQNKGGFNFLGDKEQSFNFNKPLLNINRLIINKESGNVQFTTSLKLVTNNSEIPQLNLINGNLIFSSVNSIELEPETVLNGGLNQSFIDGFVKRKITGSFTFPVGSGKNYRPVTISNVSPDNSEFMVRYFDTTPSISRFTGEIKSISDCEYWEITGGTASSKITCNWTNSCSDIAPSVKLVYKNTAVDDWSIISGASTTGNSVSGSFQTPVLTNYGLFTFGYNTVARIIAFANLQSKLDGSLYTTLNKTLYFRYNEEYITDGFLNYRIYGEDRAIVTNLPQKPKKYGMNDLDVDLTGKGLQDGKVYTLEVVDEKNYVRKLRFRFKETD